MSVMLATSAAAGELGDWKPLLFLLFAYVVVVGCFAFVRKREQGYGPADLLVRTGRGLEHVTKIPGWAAASMGQATFGLLVAGMGFYNDVAWHVRLGRDKELFTPPHTGIVLGLFLIASAALLGIAIATLEDVDTRIRIRSIRVPWSMIPLALFGFSALGGFPLDDLWHRAYGIDVTMWSPTHLLMILGASFSPLAAWLVLAEAKVRPTDGRWARGVHVAVATMALLGLSSAQGEFSFGVPQFQQLYHPLLIVLAAGVALTAARLVLGRWWTLLIGGIGLLVGTGSPLGSGKFSRGAALYLGCAVAVEIAAMIASPRNRVRYAIACGIGIGTLGLGVEWLWNQNAIQPWTTALLPDAMILGVLVAVGASILGVAVGASVLRERIGMKPAAVVAGGLIVVVGLALPLPRRLGDVGARVSVHHVDASHVMVTVALDQPDAAAGARWFQAMAWQGGGFEVANMVERSRGTYITEKAVPVGGSWKTLIRLHRGAEMMSIPVWMPADAEIGAPEIPVGGRHTKFAAEQSYLLREQHGGPGWFAPAIYVLLALIAMAWVGSVAAAARGIGPTKEREMAGV